MATNTSIEWTDSTWNPIIGCSRVSEGCRHCYAEGIAARFVNTSGPYSGLTQIVNGHPQWTGKISETKQLLDPLKWNKPRRVFVNSMSDLFHENVTDEMRDRIFAVMALCPQHTFQVLTKRPERMLAYLTSPDKCSFGTQRKILDENSLAIPEGWEPGSDPGTRARIAGALHRRVPVDEWSRGNVAWPLPNVWLGVSVENQATADERIPLLLQTPAAVRFISAEPLLGPVSLEQWTYTGLECPGCDWGGTEEDATRVEGQNDEEWFACPKCGDECAHTPMDEQLGGGRSIDWVICGGESGPGARPMHPDWARSLRDQCKEARVPFFFKQWGEWLPSMQDGTPGDNQEINCSDQPVRVGKKAAGALLDGCEWREFPEVNG